MGLRATSSDGSSRIQLKNEIQGFPQSSVGEMEVATYGLVFLWLVDMKMKVPLSFELLAQSHPFFFFPVPFCSVSNSIRDFFFQCGTWIILNWLSLGLFLYTCVCFM